MTACQVRLSKGGSVEDKQFSNVCEGSDQVAFEFEWDGNGEASGQAPATIPFPGGKAALMQWLRDEAEPRFSRQMTRKFKELMGGDGLRGDQRGMVADIAACIEQHWSSCTQLLNQLHAVDEEGTESQFLEFRAVPLVPLNIDELADRICRFDVANINYETEANRVVLVNATFKRDVLKCFNTTADEAAQQIKEQISAALQVVLGKFVDRVSAAKDNATSIRERNQAVAEAKLSRREVEDMVERIQPQLADVERKMECLKADLGGSFASSTPALSVSSRGE